MTPSTNRTEHLAVLQLIFLAVSVATFAVACGADGSAADSEGDDGNIHWQISGNELTLSKMEGQSSGDMDDYGPERPEWESGEGWDDVTTITVLDGVTSIGGFAFHEQASIASVTLPDSVKTIGNNAFQKCSALKSVDLGKGLTSMGFLVFDECVSLTSIELPIGVTTVPMFIFNNCSSLSSVVIGEAVTLLEAGAFQYCTSLTSIELPDMLNEIDMGVFVGCTSLTSIEIPDAVSYIGPSAFSDCSGLVSVILPDSLPSIGSVVFHKCTALKSVTIGKAVASIDYGQFQYCNAINTVYYNSTVLELDKDQAYWEAQNILFIHADSGSVTGAAFSGTLPSADAFTPPAGKGFDKYNTERGGTGQSYSPGDAYSLEGRQVLYAVWKDVPKLDITFNPNGGTGDAHTQKVTSGEPTLLDENEFSREGYTFKEWNTKADGTGTPYLDGQTVTIYENLTLYAQWSPNPVSTFKVTVGTPEHGTIKISGVFPNPITVCNGQTWVVTGSVLTIEDTERGRTFVLAANADNGYVFKNFTDGTSPLADTGTINEDLAVSAAFEAAPVPEYTVMFSPNGHGKAPGPIRVKSGETIEEPTAPTAEGYTFGGWFKEPSCINKWNFADDTVVQNTVLYAKWTQDPVAEYTVTFDANGHGTAPDSVKVKSGDKVPEPKAPTAEGYRFGGWYADRECTEDMKWDFAKDTVADDFTLFAKWVEQATATFDANGHGTAPAAVTVDKGSKISEPPAPSADGYRFDGWYADRECTEDMKWDFNTDTVVESFTLYAKWTKVGSSSLPVIAAAVGIIALLVLVSAVAYRRP